MKENKTMIVFLAIVITINLLVNLYIFSRTRAIFPQGNGAWWIAAALFWLVAFSYVIGRFAERAGPFWLAEPMIKTGSFWMGAMVYLTLIFLLIDIFRGINGLFNITDFLRFNWMSGKGKTAILLVYSISAIILIAGYLSAKNPVVRKQAVQISKPVPNGIQNVVLVSDIHLGMMISNGRLKRLVEMVNRQNADLVLLAGDVFDEDLGPVIKNNMGDLLKNLRAKQGVFAILGNHEFFGNANAAQKYLENHHITVLRDSTVKLPNGITIVGREDITGERMNGKPRKSIEKLLVGVDSEKPVFMLDHQPYKLADVASHNIDLQVSGHTHHGQMWPFNYITKAVYEISRGYGKINNTHFYVSSGFGTWGPPIRTSSRSEIIVLEITGK
ncbi:MAG TPA: metallophosphoesterase [Draconibacterium sp.]|nr:metallophosphoesterase [Draconibacterium sp.]